MFNKKTMKTTWKELNIKEKLAIISACLAFIAGWTLTGIAAFVPLLLSEQSILFILGQAMTYSAAVFGVSMYFNAESVKMKREINRHIEHMERMQIQRMNLRNGIDEDEIPEREDEDEE
jgi:hypothetical protein